MLVQFHQNFSKSGSVHLHSYVRGVCVTDSFSWGKKTKCPRRSTGDSGSKRGSMTSHEMRCDSLMPRFTHAPYWIQITFKHFERASFIDNSHSLICEIRSFKGTSSATRCHISLANEYYRLFSSDAYCTRVSTHARTHPRPNKCLRVIAAPASTGSGSCSIGSQLEWHYMFAKKQKPQ